MAFGKEKKILMGNLGADNPVFAQVLGICSTLAVTNVLKNTLVMCLGLVFTLTLSNATVSALRKWIPSRVRMMVEVLIIACYVIIVDIVLKAYLPDISRQLGPYVGLIITNCIIMGRAEAFALSNPPWLSAVDGFGAGVGYSYVLLCIALFRELLGSGTFWGHTVVWEGWTNWTIMVMAPGAFFMLAIFIWIVKGLILKINVMEAFGATFAIFFAAVFTNNILLTNYLGMCSFLGASREVKTATGLGAAVIFVMTATSALNWLVYHGVLVRLGLEYLRFIVFIIVIARSSWTSSPC